ncbi:MAG: hypothetical protein CMF70_04310 [Magnetovibrio sp.]|nr:hypothetical protein [Magnetovibrio sp.]
MVKKISRPGERKTKEKTRKNLSEHYSLKAAGFADAGNIEEAIQSFEKAVAVDPNSADNFYNLGVLLTSQSKLPQALDSYKKAVAINPFFSEAYNNLGGILKELGSYEDAIANYEKVLSINPESAETFYNLASVLAKMGNINKAIETYQKAIKIQPGFLDAHNNLGNLYLEISNWKKAANSFKKALEINPQFTGVHINLGNAMKKLRDWGEAASSYRNAIDIDPSSAEAYTNLGNILKETGDINKAVKYYEKAVALNPNLVEAQCNLSHALQHMGKFDRALEILENIKTTTTNKIAVTESLIELLNYYAPESNPISPHAKAENALRSLNLIYERKGFIPDQHLAHVYQHIQEILEFNNLPYESYPSQCWRGTVFNQDCSRHMMIFDKYHIIPKHCFGCYKVLIEPRNVVELIKLLVVFNLAKLPADNPRKCLVELRAEVSGTYKGLVYCRNLQEGTRAADYISKLVHEKISGEIRVSVKRGCSEYSIKFPEYNRIFDKEHPPMEYNENWRANEEYADKFLASYKYPFPFTNHNHAGVSLHDAFVIKTWLAYAASIGDLRYLDITGSNINNLPMGLMKVAVTPDSI